jgi:hypothetical protein
MVKSSGDTISNNTKAGSIGMRLYAERINRRIAGPRSRQLGHKHETLFKKQRKKN